MSNHVPVTDELSTPVQFAELATIIQQIVHLERYYEAKVQAGRSHMRPGEPTVHFGTKSAACAALIDSNSGHSATCSGEGMAHRWVPPASVHEDNDIYTSSLFPGFGHSQNMKFY